LFHRVLAHAHRVSARVASGRLSPSDRVGHGCNYPEIREARLVLSLQNVRDAIWKVLTQIA
jgi:hypothetical protein